MIWAFLLDAAVIAGCVTYTHVSKRYYERLLRAAHDDFRKMGDVYLENMRCLSAELRKTITSLGDMTRERDLYLDLWKGNPLAKARWARTGKPLPVALIDCLRETEK